MVTVAAGNLWSEFFANESAAAVCNYVALRGGAALGATAGGLIGSAGTPVGTVSGAAVGSFVGAAGGAALGAYLCPDGSPSSGEFPSSGRAPQYTGGQCAGVAYDVTVSGEVNTVRCSNGEVEINPGSSTGTGILGPLGDLRTEEIGTACDDGKRGVAYYIQSGSPPVDVLVGTRQTGFPGQLRLQSHSISSISVVRSDGQPDTCGNTTPPNNPQPGVDFPFPKDDPAARRPVDIDVDFGPGGLLNLVGDLVLEGLDFIGDALVAVLNFDGLGLTYNPVTGEVNPALGSPNAEQPEPEDDPLQELHGVYYTSIATTSAARYVLLNNGRFYFPRVGSIRFTGGGEQSEEFSIHGQSGYVPNPNPAIFRGIVVTKNITIDSITTRTNWVDVKASCS